jgi:hypothetical protein
MVPTVALDAAEKRKVRSLPGIEPGPPSPYSAAIPTELSLLLDNIGIDWRSLLV